MQIPLSTGNPIVRPLATFVLLALAVYSLLAHWEHHGGGHPSFGPMGNLDIHVLPGYGGKPSHTKPTTPPPYNGTGRAVVAHFMLGNTYPFTEEDWAQTLDLAEDTGLDALALNLGPEPWQLKQAQVAYNLVVGRIINPIIGRRPVRLFLSLDMNVLHSSTVSDANTLSRLIAMLMYTQAQFEYNGRPVLTTFGGHGVNWGGKGWPGFLAMLERRMTKKPMFWPSFFMNPEAFIALPYVDGTFFWNNAWPITNHRMNLEDDIPFLDSEKPYMAAVSPCFFTHYGRTGEWAFNKNWIYNSDELLYPSRWAQLMAHDKQPEIIHVTSWNDYGESHYIAPVLGAEPGSANWTKGMDHEAFRDMTKYFASRWRDGAPEVGDEVVLWLWYRTHPAAVGAKSDEVGPPGNRGRAKDLVNMVILVPDGLELPQMEIVLGPLTAPNDRTIPLMAGRMNSFKVPFVPGHVRIKIKSAAGTHLSVWGREIDESAERYNFNMWSGVWRAVA